MPSLWTAKSKSDNPQSSLQDVSTNPTAIRTNTPSFQSSSTSFTEHAQPCKIGAETQRPQDDHPPQTQRSPPAMSVNRSGSTETGPQLLGHSRMFWLVVLLAVAIYAIVQCTWVTFRYYKQETGTKVAFLERKDRAEIVKLVQLVYCPQDWLNISAIQSDPQTDPLNVVYAVSLIPYLDFYALKHLQLVLDPNSETIQVDYTGLDAEWTNGEAIFRNELMSSQAWWYRLRSAMEERNVATLVDFLEPYANRMANHTTYHLRFTIRHGRMCQVVRTNQAEYVNNGVDKPEKVQLEFNHPGLVDGLPRPHVFYSLHDYPAIAPVNEEGLTQWPSSVVLGPEENSTFTYTDSRSYLHVYYNQQFQIKYRHRDRYNKRSRPCSGESRYRYPEDYLMWQCNLACTDEAFIAAGQHCSELNTVSDQTPVSGIWYGAGKRYKIDGADIANRPCSSGTFNGKREAYGEALYANPIFLEKSSFIEQSIETCRNERQCNKLIECQEWKFQLSDTDQIERLKETMAGSNDKSGASHQQSDQSPAKLGHGYASSYQNHTDAFRHTLWFTVSEGMSVIEYPLLTSDGYLGELGGIISLFLGASILTCLDWSYKAGEYLYMRSTGEMEAKKS